MASISASNLFVAQERRQPLGAAEAADAARDRRGRGILRASGEREQALNVSAVGERAGQFAGLRRAAENQDADQVRKGALLWRRLMSATSPG